MSSVASKLCLILVDNVGLGHQVATLLKQSDWQTHVVYRDYEAYGLILRGEAFGVVADIDAPNLGGLAVLAYCHHHYPSIVTYAITESEGNETGKLAQQVAGCKGYFYLGDDNLQIDTGRGMAAELLTLKSRTAQA
ncbi:MAG TPA: DNA-binding response regulator [Mariprofundaceae bacterium]|nr:DNA-binding response regulator [Mariprofundaceae bacterium]